MRNYEDVIDRLKSMECPAGSVENKVLDILISYKVANPNNIVVKRDEKLDNNDIEGYRAEIIGVNPMRLALLCRSGQDDYVAKVVDVSKF